MISSIIIIILQLIGVVKPETDLSFMKVYIPVCIVEVIVYFKILSWWGSK